MGCDIHAHIEYQEDASLRAYQWFASPELDRSYVLFALMAGVRMSAERRAVGQEIGPVVPPRGIPVDISHAARRGHGVGPALRTLVVLLFQAVAEQPRGARGDGGGAKEA